MHCLSEEKDVLIGDLYTSGEIMQTKLTLRMDDRLVARAKAHARRTGRSVSRIVADYFSLLKEEEAVDAKEISPLVEKLKGLMRGEDISREDYRKHISDKYL